MMEGNMKKKKHPHKETSFCWPCEYMTTGIDHGCLFYHKVTQVGPVRSATPRLQECKDNDPVWQDLWNFKENNV